MKTKYALTLAFALATPGLCADAPGGFIVHEWGTFTSVQGGDGALVPWHAPQIGDLPGFVYNWNKPGFNRQPTLQLAGGKSLLTTLQRMETPVIYFYPDAEMAVDVEVQFPKGFITEWFPQATQIGPAILPTNSVSTTVMNASKESMIRWHDFQLLPAQNHRSAANQLPMDSVGTHYFSARETDSAFVRIKNPSRTHLTDEVEKFLFYRGSGNFNSPLVVTTSDDGTVSIENTGAATLSHLFLLQVQEGRGEWAHQESLRPGTKQVWQKLVSIPMEQRIPLEELQKQLGRAMTDALISAGLFPAEAQAMVKTWDPAWFAEEGVRVLYLLPRAWTDETLPLKLNPQPRELVRVMVGRAEIITPQTQKEIAGELAMANSCDAEAKAWLKAYPRKFGRFALPAFQLANQYLSRQTNKPFASAVRN